MKLEMCSVNVERSFSCLGLGIMLRNTLSHFATLKLSGKFWIKILEKPHMKNLQEQ